MEAILSVEEMKRMDRLAVEELGLPSICLMENAGRSCAQAISDYIDSKDIESVAILCGPGNNGGDGYVIARCLANMGLIVDTFATCESEKQSPDARVMRGVADSMGLPMSVLKPGEDLPDLNSYGLLIDALLGTGLSGAARGLCSDLIDSIDDCKAQVISIDIPSGVQGDTGAVDGSAVTADLTLSMAASKRGLVLTPGCNHVGEMQIVDIGYMPALFLEGKEWVLPDEEDLHSLLPHRMPSGHKGDFGKVLVLAGSDGMLGAALLCAGAVLRSGAGMVKLACPPEVASQVAQAMPEVMTVTLPSEATLDDLKESIEWADAVAVGPGLGREPARMQLVRDLLANCELPLVLDADGLFAFKAAAQDLCKRKCDLLITPHHGEFQRMLDAGEDQLSHSGLVEAGLLLTAEAELTLLLKGAPSITLIPDGQVFLNASGNDGMATAGSGDVLTGLLAGLLAQGMGSEDASILGAHLHGLSGDMSASRAGKRGMTAVDLLMHLPLALQSFEAGLEHEHAEESGCGCGGHDEASPCDKDNCEYHDEDSTCDSDDCACHDEKHEPEQSKGGGCGCH
jgi:ADP-dependent NAD(P)H-hydrate dehydratase / NAD(P)H-hydrate epimerase